MRIPTIVKTGLAVATAAGIGARATAAGSRWYRRLDKPSWQPPAQAFGPVWTVLYALLAVAGARAIDRARPDDRRPLVVSYATNLALNAGWTAIFFRARRPDAALVEIAALNASNLTLMNQMRRADSLSAALVTPYVAWTAFATALSVWIARHNPSSG